MSEAAFALWMMGIGAMAMVVIGMWLIYWVYKAKLLEREERRLMIERGITPPTPVPMGWPGVKMRELELQAEERRLLIEKGLDAGPSSLTSDFPNVLAALLPKREQPAPEHYLYRGLKALAFGLGLAAAYVIFNRSGINVSDEARNWFLFFAVLSPFFVFYGIGSLVYYQVTKNKAQETSSVPGPDR